MGGRAAREEARKEKEEDEREHPGWDTTSSESESLEPYCPTECPTLKQIDAEEEKYEKEIKKLEKVYTMDRILILDAVNYGGENTIKKLEEDYKDFFALRYSL